MTDYGLRTEERMQFVLRAAAVAGALALICGAAQAKPEYAMREKKACAYCHNNPAGGGARNPRGVYYGMHNHTFAGYDEAKVMGKPAGGGSGESVVVGGAKKTG